MLGKRGVDRVFLCTYKHLNEPDVGTRGRGEWIGSFFVPLWPYSKVFIPEWMNLRRQQKITGVLFISPTAIVLVLIILLPLLFSFVVSFYGYTFIHPRFDQFLGAQNYLRGFQDQYFWNSLEVTLIFVVAVVLVEFLVGFSIALLLNRDIRFKGIFYTILTIPMVMAPVAVGLIWKMLLHPDLGVANYFLSLLGISPVNWLGSTKMALWTLLLIDVWQQMSFMILILLAGLTSLPKEPFEAAKIDGANARQTLFYITLHLMKPVIVVALLIRTIFAFRTYDLVYVLTKGGPGVSTDLISYHIYKKTFMGLDLGQASALSYVLLILIMAIVVVLFRQMANRQESLY